MAHLESEDFQLYFSRIRPIYHQLFGIAHAITGSCEQAEYALQYAMLDCWAAGDHNASHHGFREGLRSGVIRAALKTEEGENDWPGLNISPDSDDPILLAIAQEGRETQRMLALRYGCGFSPRRIARITDTENEQVRTLLHRFDARTRRRLSAADRRHYEQLLTRALRSQLSQPGSMAPEMGSVFRTFQADAAEVSRPSRLPARILRAVCMVLLALLCILAFWLMSVLMQPVQLEETSVQIETLQQG